MPSGHCHCGAIRYAVEGEAQHHAICHCEDCRRSSGALMTAWIAFPKDALQIELGAPKIYRSSENGERHFCGDCGTGLFYFNEAMLPGIVDMQSVTLDDPERHAPGAHIQTADALPWEAGLADLPKFERYPG